jgi:hypothetical protein
MSLQSDVAGVLRRHPADRIAYSLDHIAVDKAQMEFVAKAIDNGDIGVKITPTGNLLGAAYSSYKGRRPEAGQKRLIGEIALPSASVMNSSIGKAAIFHESVHALLDVRPRNISVRNGDEALAYIADAMYLKTTNTPVQGDALAKAIYDAAFDIIGQHKMLTRRGVALNWSHCGDLLAAINAHPAYR